MCPALEPWGAFTLLGALLFAVGNALQKYGPRLAAVGLRRSLPPEVS